MSGAIISILAPKGGDYLREGDYSREAIISNISHRSSRPKYIALLYQARKEKSEIHEHYYRKKLKKSCDFVTIQSIFSIIQKLWSYSSGGELGTMMIMTMMMMNPKVVKIHLFLIFLPVLIFFFALVRKMVARERFCNGGKPFLFHRHKNFPNSA